MKYKGILFDMDGTVLDTGGDLADAVNHTLSHFGYPLRSYEEILAFLGNGAYELIRLSVPTGTDAARIDEVLSWYRPYYDSHCLIRTAPYAGIVEMLEKLKQSGRKLCVVSNKQDTAVKELAGRFFDGMLVTAVGERPGIRRKPYPDMVLAAAELLGCSTDECLYVGDTEVDIATAANSGMDCATVTWGFRSRELLEESGAVNIFTTTEELTEFILNN